jgi:DeoR family transcriptional regulator, fructose operon transcriptional repressor
VNARHERILEQVRLRREVSVRNLARLLRVAPVTVRRDLASLERANALTRTHGGAVLSSSAVIEFAFLDRAQEHLAQKRAIARHVAAAVRPGMTLVLDTGTTVLEVARAIAGIPRLRVLTSSLPIASALHAHANIDLVLLGGSVRRDSPDLSGPLTEENLRQFQTELAVLGADAVSRGGLYTSDLGIARISRAMIASARERWVVADSSKFARRAFVKFADWSQVSLLVTDDGLAAADREWVSARSVQVHIAACAGQ